ncbi:MAG: class I SAM-dependent methyltransferase [Candidatus Aureabacteria bacterium]|nr:class I SAM-dependent methyltransferase [Candidatus Auribacterota bacterium]
MIENNRHIFNTTLKNSLSHDIKDLYQQEMRNLRMKLIKQFCSEKTVLDMGCGSGEYTCLTAKFAKEVIGLDFGEAMLIKLKERLNDKKINNVYLMQNDMESKFSLKDAAFDTVYSFATLYYISNLSSLISEMYRVLKPGGHAIFSLGNLWSINTLLARNADSGLRSYHVSPVMMRKMISQSRLRVESLRCFQLFPMYGGNIFSWKNGRFLTRLVTMQGRIEKRIFSLKIKGKMFDEILSSFYLLRFFAFRYLFICKKDS